MFNIFPPGFPAMSQCSWVHTWGWCGNKWPTSCCAVLRLRELVDRNPDVWMVTQSMDFPRDFKWKWLGWYQHDPTNPTHHPIIPSPHHPMVWNFGDLEPGVTGVNPSSHRSHLIRGPSSKVTAIQPSRRISTWPLAPRRVWSVPLPPSSRWISQPAMVSWSICNGDFPAILLMTEEKSHCEQTARTSVVACWSHDLNIRCTRLHSPWWEAALCTTTCTKRCLPQNHKQHQKTALISWKQWIHVRKTVVIWGSSNWTWSGHQDRRQDHRSFRAKKGINTLNRWIVCRRSPRKRTKIIQDHQ